MATDHVFIAGLSGQDRMNLLPVCCVNAHSSVLGRHLVFPHVILPDHLCIACHGWASKPRLVVPTGRSHDILLRAIAFRSEKPTIVLLRSRIEHVVLVSIRSKVVQLIGRLLVVHAGFNVIPLLRNASP